MAPENTAAITTHKSPLRTQLTIVINCMEFHPNHVVATPDALALMEKLSIDPIQLLTTYVRSDCGNCHPNDAELNQQALADGNRLMSVYRLFTPEVLTATPREKQQDLPTVWVIADVTLCEKDDPKVRNGTTVLRPQEY